MKDVLIWNIAQLTLKTWSSLRGSTWFCWFQFQTWGPVLITERCKWASLASPPSHQSHVTKPSRSPKPADIPHTSSCWRSGSSGNGSRLGNEKSSPGSHCGSHRTRQGVSRFPKLPSNTGFSYSCQFTPSYKEQPHGFTSVALGRGHHLNCWRGAMKA